MTNDEFGKFADRLFVAFPGVWEWLNEKSPDPLGTQAIWRRALKNYTYDECIDVLADWETGERPAPKAYERDQLHIMLRQSVEFDRDQKRRKNGERSEQDRVNAMSEEYRRTRDKDYKPLALNIPELRPIYERGAKMRKEFMDGLITKEEYEHRKAELVKEVQ